MSSDLPKRLSVPAWIAAGLRSLSRDHRMAFVRAATLPVFFSLLLTASSCLLWSDQPDTSRPLAGLSFLALLYLLELGPITLFAMAWYRVLIPDLIKHHPHPNPFARYLRMLRCGLLLVLSAYLIVIVTGALGALVIAGVCETWPLEHPEFLVSSFVRSLIIAGLVGLPFLFYWATRLSVLFPAAAINRPYRVIEAWRDTREPGLRLTCAFAVVMVTFFALEILLALLAGMASSAAPWMESLAVEPFGDPIDWLTILVTTGLQYTGLAVVFAICAEAFRQYGSDRAPPVS